MRISDWSSDVCSSDLAVDDTAEKALADRHVDDGARALDGVAFLDGRVGAEDHDADIVGLEVQGHALDAAVELDHFARLDVVETVDARDAVADRQHLPDFGHLCFGRSEEHTSDIQSLMSISSA